MVRIPFLHSKSFRNSGKVVWFTLMAYYQRGVSRRRRLKVNFGGTCGCRSICWRQDSQMV